MANPTFVTLRTFAAKCADCGNHFDHPSYGDMSYGQFIFQSFNGAVFATTDALRAESRLIEVLLPPNTDADVYQTALATLCDPVMGQAMGVELRCTKCASTHLEFWGGNPTGEMQVQVITYTDLLALNRKDLLLRVQKVDL